MLGQLKKPEHKKPSPLGLSKIEIQKKAQTKRQQFEDDCKQRSLSNQIH